jgi:hypothetical protein
MAITWRIAIFLLSLCFAGALHADDELISIDSGAGLITVQQRGALKTFRLKPFTEITINGQKANASQLKAGMSVTVRLSDAQTAVKIAATGNFAAPGAAAPGAPAPLPPIGGVKQTDKISFKMRVDGGDVVTIQAGKLWIEHVDWDKPKDIAINGIVWRPTWKGNRTDEFVGFTPPLAPFAGTVSVKKTKGRGELTVVEPPTAANNGRLIFKLADGGGGADDYEVRISW